MKIMFICKKHYKQLMKEFEKTNPPEAVNGVLQNQNISHGMLGSLGEPFVIHIKPYLKTIKIIDAPKFEMRMPVPELDLGMPIRRRRGLDGIEWS